MASPLSAPKARKPAVRMASCARHCRACSAARTILEPTPWFPTCSCMALLPTGAEQDAVGLAASAGPPRGHTCLVLDAFYQTRAQQEVTYVTGQCEVAARILPVWDWEAVGAPVHTLRGSASC